jgi:competence protein ComEA
MLKKILALTALLFSLSSFAAVDVNKASAAELDGIKGIGPSLSGKILKESNKGSFKDWPDLMHRVSGIGEKSAAKFSTQGLTVNGNEFKGAVSSSSAKPHMSAKPASSSEDKSSDKSKSAKP